MPTANYKRQWVVLAAEWPSTPFPPQAGGLRYHLAHFCKSRRQARKLAKMYHKPVVVERRAYKTTLMLLND